MDLNAEQIFRDFVIELQKQINIQKTAGIDIDNCRDIPWTEIVKEAFSEIGRIIEGIKVYATGHDGEYLLDVLWDSTENEKHGPILGVESEWGNIKDVEEDFYKLMYVKCRFKVLVYSSTSEVNRLELQRMIKDGLINFDQHLIGEQYLFVDMNNFEPWRITTVGFIVTQATLKNRKAIELSNICSVEWDDKIKNYIL